MKKISLLLIIFALFIINNNLFSKNIYLFSRTTFSNSQFWEKQVNKNDSDNYRRIFSNYFTGSAGIGIEMIIWDIGKKRGSRLFFKGGVDLIFAG
ncbi:MAG: hypothetical protein KAT05_04615, partial [Spirochaetes bacterium]|nr:hypothetical protein [Spirochaetota bacterium]